MDKQKLFKVLMNGESMNGGSLKWSLPRKRGKGWQPGDWHEVDGEIRVCDNGLHLTTEPYNKWYKWGCTVYEARGEGDNDTSEDKTAFRRARLLQPVPDPEWIVKTQALIDDLKNINWLKPDGNPNVEWKLYPNRAAAWDAARAAARDAAWDAAWAAARDAAWDAAWAAACAAARDAARAAARAAARDAAWDAARDAARDAAWDAARAAARDAAWDAAWAAQLNILANGICSDLELAETHRLHIAARWEVWQKGYGLLCDVSGVLYVYEKP